MNKEILFFSLYYMPNALKDNIAIQKFNTFRERIATLKPVKATQDIIVETLS